MGVDLLVFSNHKIRGKTFESRIKEMESFLETEIKDIRFSTFSDKVLPSKTELIKEVFFYTNFKNAKDWFEEFDEILIHSNYQYLSHLKICDKAMLSDHHGFSQRWIYWMENLGDKYLRETTAEEYLNYNKSWNLFRDYNKNLVRKMGGDKIIYFADANFENEQVLLYEQGLELSEFISKMKEVGKFFDLELLFDDYDSICENESIYAFYENLNS